MAQPFLKIRKLIPEFVKRIARFIFYNEERTRFFREIKIRRSQNRLIHHYDSQSAKLIVFIIPGADWATGKDKISGGIMSIVSICEETKRLREIHRAEPILCTHTSDNLLLRHTQFESETDIFRFSQLISYFNRVEEILIHVPEFMAEYLMLRFLGKEKKWLKNVSFVHVNVLNQNIRLMPSPDFIRDLQRVSNRITITTAHQKYCSPYYRDYYDAPLHKLSVWVSPEQYYFRAWKNKENLLVVSPDKHPMKENILLTLRTVPGLVVEVIENITYLQFKDLIARAKWSLTFGEGLDGYIVEPIFSGAIGFAVYNEEFFTEDFRGLQGIYPSYTEMAIKLAADIMRLNSESTYTETQSKQFELCSKYYSYDQYRDNIAQFYLGNYTYK